MHEDDLFVAILRFSEHATIHEHPGPNDTVVVCLEGQASRPLEAKTAPLRAGEQARWPRDVPHRLWTEASTMQTLMIERPVSCLASLCSQGRTWPTVD